MNSETSILRFVLKLLNVWVNEETIFFKLLSNKHSLSYQPSETILTKVGIKFLTLLYLHKLKFILSNVYSFEKQNKHKIRL